MAKIIFVFSVKMNVWMVWNLYIFFVLFLRHKHPIIELAISCTFEGAISFLL